MDNSAKIAEISKHDDENIIGFFGDYRYLSNYHKCPIFYQGRIYSSTEAAYHSAKTHNVEDKNRLTKMDPKESKAFGRTITLRPDWDDIKLQVMLDVNHYKFHQGTELGKWLHYSNNKHLEEANWWKDMYWGTYNGKGENMLGKVLMEIREINTKILFYV